MSDTANTAGFSLLLQSASQSARIESVASFVGQDASGSFGILPGRNRMMTVLGLGLARFRVGAGAWQYLAFATAVLDFADKQLCLYTPRYMQGQDHARMADAFAQVLAQEEVALGAVRESLHAMEQALQHRLRTLERSAP
jgi:F-type H+-transporting ATPase subunit epsilon